MKNSRKNWEDDEKKFIQEIQKSQENCFEKEKNSMQEFSDEKKQSKLNYLKDSQYLNDLLQTNATKAASRITSVRRWH